MAGEIPINLPIRGTENGQAGFAHFINGEYRFIADDPAESAAEGVGIAEAALIGFGETLSNTVLRARAGFDTALGREGTEAQADFAEVKSLLAPLQAEHPIALAVGQSVPGFLLPASKAAQTVGGVAEGTLADPENPFLGGLIGGAGGFLGGVIGQKLANKVAARASGAVGRLTARGVPTTLAQRTGSEAERSIEAGLQAIPVINRWAAAPARAQQTALNRGAASVFGFEGRLTPKGLGEVKAGISKSFQQVQRAIPDQQLDSVLVDRLEDAGVIDQATKEFMQGFGIVDGEALMAIRSNLNNDMADAFINANRKEGRQLRSLLNEVDEIITSQMPDELVGQWATARQQWQFLTAIRKGKAISGAGDVNLASMNSALKAIYPNFRVGQELPGAAQGFGELIQALDELPKALQSSGTAERAAAVNLLTNPLSSATGIAGGILPAARAVAQPGADVGVAGRLAGRLLINDETLTDDDE